MFYDQLKKNCKEKNTSPSAVALAAGLSKTNVTYWRKGQAPKVGASEYWDDKAVNKAPGQDDLSGFVIEEVMRRYINEFDAAQPLPEETRKTRKEVLKALEGLSEIWRRGA